MSRTSLSVSPGPLYYAATPTLERNRARSSQRNANSNANSNAPGVVVPELHSSGADAIVPEIYSSGALDADTFPEASHALRGLTLVAGGAKQ